MYYVIQENIFREQNYDVLEKSLQRLGLPYEIVKVLPFVDDFEFKTDRRDVFPFGALKMARLARKYNWVPGSQMNANHDYDVYSRHYGSNLLNYGSEVHKFVDDFEHGGSFFVRPCEDTKVFTGRVFRNTTEWREYREHLRTCGHTTVLTDDTRIQVCEPKPIQKEIRFWIVGGEVVTQSQYKLGSRVAYSEVVDDEAKDFCRRMVDIFQLNTAFVMDVCQTPDGYKIVECGCINCAGFYLAGMQKLLVALEDTFSKQEKA